MSIDEFIRARLWEDEAAALASGGYIDKARELRETLGKRHILTTALMRSGGDLEDSMLRFLAYAWADHDDFQPEWTL
ncbi:hypothetical protein ACIBG0_15515 [Nocardia sp. NPDC050630]|uniref:hypothetical protein n=1 Tax=Nocardia sp. NPDC050630 TaxID=3364321 RepID=UPI0037B19AF7